MSDVRSRIVTSQGLREPRREHAHRHGILGGRDGLGRAFVRGEFLPRTWGGQRRTRLGAWRWACLEAAYPLADSKKSGEADPLSLEYEVLTDTYPAAGRAPTISESLSHRSDVR